MPRGLRELGAVDALAEIEEKGLDKFTVFKSSSKTSLSRANSLIKSIGY
jgi:hypothetical protein